MEFNGGSTAADHLCVLVHGLWGNPQHMRAVAQALRSAHGEDTLHLLLAKRNSDSFTYDGIERGGERVCLEIEEELEKIKAGGGRITKLSVVGYSLGGLVARYAVGLLYAKGVFDAVQPVNFTTFASPHLGVRTPLRGWFNQVWNELGARTLSMSGQQLFIVDDFRGTGRPLLAILADPDSIFVSGLRRFRRRTLYANVVNDRSVNYYTAAIAKADPYTDTAKVRVNYLPGYEDVILDPADPVSPAAPKGSGPRTLGSLATGSLPYVKNAPLVAALVVLVPIGVTVFLLNSVVQTFRSSRRIRQHELGLAGIQVDKYRMPIWIRELRGTVDGVYENLSGAQQQSYLASSDDDDGDDGSGGDDEDDEDDDEETAILALERKQSHPHWPTLALTPSQFSMISALDDVGWRKYRVWIHAARHSHAAIIVRSDTKKFDEGRVVLDHWVKEEFLI
ncbi:putative serine esterase-domain-containing protein [Xylariaceae sp. FL0804]|nr:putative serine esterase-domain-containing protein [Xylariaceae sp. FL0804]